MMLSSLYLSDIVSSQSPFKSYLGAQASGCRFNGTGQYGSTLRNEQPSSSAWKDPFWFQNVARTKAAIVRKGHFPVIRATILQNDLERSDENFTHSSVLQHESSSRLPLSPNEDEPVLADNEKLRRSRISKANKGKIPWNKGRKHSAETIAKIRERTRTAMLVPEVREKLLNLGHAQSEEVRIRIGSAVRARWLRRRTRLMVQETCFFVWSNAIAEASRKGYHGEEELQWNSYEILVLKLQESRETRIIESADKSKRKAPKPFEQRMKIAEAVRAKWEDPEYKERVRLGMAKFRAECGETKEKKTRTSTEMKTTKEVEERRKRPPRLKQTKIPVVQEVIPTIKKKAEPTYKDPKADIKLKMIMGIRKKRLQMEKNKRKAIKKARLMIIEAEKAAKALEAAAQTNALARESLIEARKLITEATRSLEVVEKEKGLIPKVTRKIKKIDSTDMPRKSGRKKSSLPKNEDPEKMHINGHHRQSSTEILERSFNFEASMQAASLNGHAQLTMLENSESIVEMDRPSSHKSTENMLDPPDETASSKLGVDPEIQAVTDSEKAVGQAEKPRDCTAPPIKLKKRWVRGRCIEVVEGMHGV